MARSKMKTRQRTDSAESGAAGGGGGGRPAGGPLSYQVPRGQFSSVASAPRSASAARTARVDRFSDLRATSEAALGITSAARNFAKIRGERVRGAVVTRDQALLAVAGFLLYDGAGELRVPPRADYASHRIEAGTLLSGLSDKTVRGITTKFMATGAINLEPPRARGPAPLNTEDLDAMEPRVREWVRSQLQEADEPTWVTRQAIQEFIYEEIGVRASSRRISKLCEAWELDYSRLERAPVALDPLRAFKRRIHIMQRRQAIIDGTILFYLDESFANLRLQNAFSYHPRGSAFSQFAVRRGSGLGKRLCFVHVLGTEGLCVSDDSADMPELGDVVSPKRSCEMMFSAAPGGSTGDYHGNFDHAIFMSYMEGRFLPWILWRYPDIMDGPPGARKPHIGLVLDNAPYHVGTTTDLHPGSLRFDPRSLNKSDLIDAMNAADLFEITVQHSYIDADGNAARMDIVVYLTEEEKKVRGRRGVSPNMPEIQAACLEYLVNHLPRVLENDVEHFVRVRLNGNVSIYWNAPNFPEVMPIEMVWNRCKSFASARFTRGRNIQMLAEDIRRGMYTDDVALPGVLNVAGGLFVRGANNESESARILIDHVHYASDGGCQQQIDQDHVLTGTMRDLIIPEEYRDIVAQKGRAVSNHLARKWVAAEQQLSIAEAVETAGEDFEDSSNDEE